MSGDVLGDRWNAVLSVSADRRDREIILAAMLKPVLDGAMPAFRACGDDENRRRLGYLVDVVQHLRGQDRDEAATLAEVRGRLPARDPSPFWPSERPLPPGTDLLAERWGFSRGVDLDRLRHALRRSDIEAPALPGGGDEHLIPMGAKPGYRA